jgi:hypothetical protein
LPAPHGARGSRLKPSCPGRCLNEVRGSSAAAVRKVKHCSTTSTTPSQRSGATRRW